MSDVFSHAEQLPEEHVGLVLGNQGVDFFDRLAVVEVAALQRQALKEGTDEAQKNLRFRDFDETDGLTVGL